MRKLNYVLLSVLSRFLLHSLLRRFTLGTHALKNAGVIAFLVSGRALLKFKTNFKMAASVALEEILDEVTRSDIEDVQDSSDEETDQKSKAIESAVNCFAESSDLGENIGLFKQEAKRYLKGLYEKHARGNDSFAILCESSLNTGAVLKDEACLWLDLIYRRLSSRQRIKRPWFVEFTRDIPKEVYLALKRAFLTTTNRELRSNVYMDGNRKGVSISITYLVSVLYLFRTLTGKTVKQLQGFLHRKIPGKGKAKVLISRIKEFKLCYKYSKRQMIVSFHFGFWNTHGFPLHD